MVQLPLKKKKICWVLLYCTENNLEYLKVTYPSLTQLAFRRAKYVTRIFGSLLISQNEKVSVLKTFTHMSSYTEVTVDQIPAPLFCLLPFSFCKFIAPLYLKSVVKFVLFLVGSWTLYSYLWDSLERSIE